MLEKLRENKKVVAVVGVGLVVLVGIIVAFVCLSRSESGQKIKDEINTVKVVDAQTVQTDVDCVDVKADSDVSKDISNDTFDIVFQKVGATDVADDIKALSDVSDENRICLLYTATNKSSEAFQGIGFCKAVATNGDAICDLKTYVKINNEWTDVANQSLKSGETYEMVAIGSNEGFNSGYNIYFYGTNGETVSFCID